MFVKYCEGHNYEPYTQEIKRPLSDNLQICIENQFDYDFINPLSLEEVVTFMSETAQFENAGLQDLCLTKLALMIRSIFYFFNLTIDSKLDDLTKLFKVNSNEFNDNIINKILSDNGNLMTIDDDRVKELLNDDL